MNKYTAIWDDNGIANHCRFQTERNDLLTVLAEEYGIPGNSVRYIFHGWPRMQGEYHADVKETLKIQQTVATSIEQQGSNPTIGVVLRGIDPTSVKPGDILFKK